MGCGRGSASVSTFSGLFGLQPSLGVEPVVRGQGGNPFAARQSDGVFRSDPGIVHRVLQRFVFISRA